MPLAPGNDQATISRNISELTHHGSKPRSHAQIVAIALSNADRHPHRASGGIGGLDLSYSVNDNADAFRSTPLSRGSQEPRGNGDNDSPVDIRGTASQHESPNVTATYRKNFKFAAGGIGSFPKVPAFHLMAQPHAMPAVPKPMSPSQGTPYWTRSTIRQDQPAHIKFASGGIGDYQEGDHQHMAGGGEGMAADQLLYDEPFHGGLIGGTGAGRTDRSPLSVPSNSHVVPADAVSGLGQGHTGNGAALWAAAIRGGPWGVQPPSGHGGHGPPSAPHPASTSGYAEGGSSDARTSILAASGEVVIPPEDVVALGERVIAHGLAKRGESASDAGHRAIDEAIARIRAFNIKWLRTAPPPKK